MTQPTERLDRWLDRKKRWSHALLLLRTGNLYETFDRDAEVVARCLGDEVGSHADRSWWCCESSSLERNLRRLLNAGLRVAVGDVIDGEDEVMEVPSPLLSPSALSWPSRPTKGESEDGYLLDVWASRCGELLVRRVEPLNDDGGWFDAQALVSDSGDEEVWRDLGKTHRLAKALETALTYYRTTSVSRSNAQADVSELLDFARRQGIHELSPLKFSEEKSPAASKFELISDSDPVRIKGIAQLPIQAETDMSETATMEPETTTGTQDEATQTEGTPDVFQDENEAAEATNLRLTESEARNLGFELGWKTMMKDLPMKDVLLRLNGILTVTPLNELEKPQSPDCRAHFKLLQKTLQAGGRVEIVDDGGGEVVEEKTKRKAKTSTNGKGAGVMNKSSKVNTASKPRGDGRFTGCSAYVAKLVNTGVRGQELIDKVRKKFVGAGISWIKKKEKRLTAKQK